MDWVGAAGQVFRADYKRAALAGTVFTHYQPDCVTI